MSRNEIEAIPTHRVCQNANSGGYIGLVIYSAFTNAAPLTSSSQLRSYISGFL